jgi:hypothetical protein
MIYFEERKNVNGVRLAFDVGETFTLNFESDEKKSCNVWIVNK